ncbi:MAG: hypothetical protein M3P49_14215 [Actinomycetota bacterium]|nr:hypothetical protein [Actinomycetota bacterium]
MTTDKTIETLDKEAREALDRLADRREVLAREHAATELAAERQRERERERLRREGAEAAERENERLRAKAAELGERRRALEERAEEEAEALAATMGELLRLDPGHVRALQKAHGKAPQQRFSQTFPRLLGAWFRGRFGEVVGGIGYDPFGGAGLLERDALTQPKEGRGG